MGSKFGKLLTLAVVAVAFITVPASATPMELITNGGFEAPGLAGWSVGDQPGGSGSFFDSTTAVSGLPTVGAATGSGFAVSDQTGPGAHELRQSFTVAAGATSVIVSFDMFINDFGGGPVVDPSGLDFTSGGTSAPNQHARVDILMAGSPLLSTAPADVVTNLFTGSTGTTGPNPYVPFVFDITALVSGGGTFEIRFAEVDNSGFFNMGIDNVSIAQTVVPEPGTMLLMGLGLAGVAGTRMRRRKA